MNLNIFVYLDDGVNLGSFVHIIATLEKQFAGKAKICSINAAELKNGTWKNNALMLVIPGGADLYYAAKLNGPCNQMIKEFVYQGGIYLGICAGAYYSSKEIEFDKGGEFEVLESRELAFFLGKSIGPALSYYDYKSNKGATAAKILYLNRTDMDFDTELYLHHHGGGYFENAERFSNVQVIAAYNMSDGRNLPAIVKVNYGKGRAILSGVHFEIDPFNLDHILYETDEKVDNMIFLLRKSNAARETLINNMFL